VWVGCYWEGGGRRSKVLGCYKWAKGKPKRFVGDPPADQQRPGSGPETALHVRAVRRWRVPAVLSSKLEGIHSRDFVADCENASDFGVRETTASRDPSRPVTGFSRSDSVKHLRWFLNAIFKLAMSDGIVPNNPAAELRISKVCQPGRAVRSLTEEEVIDYLDAFDLREELIARLAIFEGMRPGEILALRWKAVRDDAVSVEERVYKRVFDTPKKRQVARRGAVGRDVHDVEGVGSRGRPEPTRVRVPQRGARYAVVGGQPLAALHTAEAGEDRLRLGNLPGSAEDQCQPVQEVRRRSEGRFRPAAPRFRRQHGGVDQFRYRTKTSRSEQTRGRGASKAQARTPVRMNKPALRSKRSNEESMGFPRCMKNGAGDGVRTRDVQLGKLAFYH
jgi:hypothetical protein